MAVIAQPARSPGVGEEDEGQQAGDVRVVGEEGAQDARQVQGSLHQVAPDEIGTSGSGVSGRVQDVDDGEHGINARRELRHGRHPERDARHGDLLLGASDAGRHGRLADQERPGDLGGGEPAEQPESQRHLGIAADRRVTAREHEAQAVVDDLGPLGAIELGAHRLDQEGKAPLAYGVAARQIDGAPPRHRGQPRPRFLRDAAGAPGGQGAGIGVLDALLRQIDVPRHAHRRGEHEGPLAAVRVGDRGLDRGVPGMTASGQSKVRIGRTSTPPDGIGTCLANASASSRSAASTR